MACLAALDSLAALRTVHCKYLVNKAKLKQGVCVCVCVGANNGWSNLWLTIF